MKARAKNESKKNNNKKQQQLQCGRCNNNNDGPLNLPTSCTFKRICQVKTESEYYLTRVLWY